MGSALFVAGGATAALLERVEGAVDPVSHSRQGWGEGAPGLRAFAVGEERDGIALLDPGTDPFGGRGRVGDEDTGGRQGRQQGAGSRGGGCLAGAGVRSERPAGTVRPGGALRGQTATGTAQATIRPPFFAPAACWGTRTLALAIIGTPCRREPPPPHPSTEPRPPACASG